MNKKQWGREYRRKNRQKAIELLGGICTRCGFSDPRALQIDHIKGGGGKEILAHSSDYIARRICRGESEDYQLLCANCNWIKRVENNETRWASS